VAWTSDRSSSSVKRSWKKATAVSQRGEWGIALDGKPIRTPGRKLLLVPAEQLAKAIAEEWNCTGETVDVREMPMTGLAYTAIDKVLSDREGSAADIARYGESDLLCYRAEFPRALAERQAQSWDQLLSWARRRFDVDFAVTSGIVHVPQPDPTVRRLAHAVAALDPFRLAALARLVKVGGSLVVGFAVLEGAMKPEDGWQTVTLDERWQLDQWGADAEAETALEARRRDFLEAARFIGLLSD
jgi:chaperone required for assembly of F1-ATPase